VRQQAEPPSTGAGRGTPAGAVTDVYIQIDFYILIDSILSATKPAPAAARALAGG
jgi:hypothetical protein